MIVQWGKATVNTTDRQQTVSYPLQGLFTQVPIVILGAYRSQAARASAGFVGAVNVTKNSFTASYGEYYAETCINTYTYIAIGY